jgi:hypothetical protein
MKVEEVTWLREAFPNYRGRTLRGEVYQAYLEAERILNGWTKQKARGCGCEYRSLANSVETKYENWLQINGKT